MFKKLSFLNEVSENQHKPYNGNCLTLALEYWITKGGSIHVTTAWNKVTSFKSWWRWFKTLKHEYGLIPTICYFTEPHFYIVKHNYKIEFVVGQIIIPYLYSNGNYRYEKLN